MGNQMQSPRNVKREADGSLAHTVSVSHPSEQSRPVNQHITYQMPYVNYSLMRTMLQGHPDGGVSYLGPSLTMPYPMTPVNMRAGSRVVVQKTDRATPFRQGLEKGCDSCRRTFHVYNLYI